MSNSITSYVSGISYYLPSCQLSNEDLSRDFPEWSVDKIMSKVGISTRRIASKDEFVSDLAVTAAKNLFAEYNLQASEIEYLILCTQCPDYFLPATACLIHDRLGLSATAGAIDINQGCSGYVYGLGVARGLIATGDIKKVLLITGDTYSKFLHPEDKGNRSIFGDGATATLISDSHPGGNIGKIALGTDGKGVHNLIVKNGGLRFPKTNDNIIHTDENGNLFNDNYLFMNGSEIFNFTIEAVPQLVQRVLEKNQLQQEDVNLFIFHQANKFMLDYLRKKIKIPQDKFFIWMENCGNTVSSTIPIALKHALSGGYIKPGYKVMIVGFGVGYSWAGTIIQF